MAAIRRRERSDRTVTWQVRWRQNGRETSETFATEREATEFRGLVDASGQNCPPGWTPGLGFREPRRDMPDLASYAAEAVAARTAITARTRADYESMIERHLGELGRMRLDEITRLDVGRWINSLDLSPKTVKNVHALLSSILRDAVRDGHIERNQAEGIGLPRLDIPDRRARVFLSRDEFALLLSHADPYWRPLIAALEGTGMRWSEATALAVSAVDLFAPSVAVTRAHKVRRGGGIGTGPPKTRKGNRTIAITDRLRDLLIPLVAGKDPGELVFTGRDGALVRYSAFRQRVWLRAVYAAQSCDEHRRPWGPRMTGAPPEPCGCPGTLTVSPRIHDLRHTHASRLIDAGVELSKIQRRLGHESIQTTVDVYGHPAPGADAEILAALRAG